MTLTEAARQLQTDAGNLSRIERGVQMPRKQLAQKIAHLYNVEVSSIIADLLPRID